MELYIGNKNYSSWSLRAWLAMKQRRDRLHGAGAPLSTSPRDRRSRRRCWRSRPRRACRSLVDEGFAVWDSLAIAEYLAERCPGEAPLAESIPGSGARAQPLRRDAQRLFALRERAAR